MESDRIGSTFDLGLEDGRIVHSIASGYCHAGTDLEQILKVFVGLAMH